MNSPRPISLYRFFSVLFARLQGDLMKYPRALTIDRLNPR
jgi:hypothetical protein